MGVYRQPDANTVEVVDRVKAILPQIQAELPPGVEIQLMADRSKPIREAIADVEFTLALAAVLVIIAIYFFLRTFRATLIPAIALPISIIGTFAGMYALGHSIDNISLLALTLAVGFVVDDAIVMLENIVRHIEAGEKPMDAAFKGAKEVSFTIVSMTLSLVAVFIPVLFMGGVLAACSTSSAWSSHGHPDLGIVSLTLTPMLCSRLLKPVDHHEKHNVLVRAFSGASTRSARVCLGAEAHRAPAAPRARITLGTFVLTVILSRRCPRASSRPRTSDRSLDPRSVRTMPRSTPWLLASPCWPRPSVAIRTSRQWCPRSASAARQRRSIPAACSSCCATSLSGRTAPSRSSPACDAPRRGFPESMSTSGRRSRSTSARP
jgi:HAE1 family hydrophobic/amphiphilic exporter-1